MTLPKERSNCETNENYQIGPILMNDKKIGIFLVADILSIDKPFG